MSPTISSTLAVFLFLLADGHLESNPIYRELIDVGIAPELEVKLPSPSLQDDLTGNPQQEMLNRLVPEERREQFFRESLVAPQLIEMSRAEQLTHLDVDGSVRRVDFWYVAYGSFDAISTENFLNEVGIGLESNGESETDGQVLDPLQLEKRQLVINKDYERLTSGRYTLLKKVRLRGTVRSYWSQTDRSIVAASMLDPRFRDDEELGNEWQPLNRNDVGELEFGKTSPYDGAGGYLKLTRVEGVKDQILVEGHLAFFEPTAWFRGANLLGSKLPAMIQANVRRTRKAILRASRDAANR